jgi:hypothetical protein
MEGHNTFAIVPSRVPSRQKGGRGARDILMGTLAKQKGPSLVMNTSK